MLRTLYTPGIPLSGRPCSPRGSAPQLAHLTAPLENLHSCPRFVQGDSALGRDLSESQAWVGAGGAHMGLTRP